jgi:drug/metabolite transporter (DMT)-like permease
MAFGEKHWWIYAVIMVIVPGIYFVNLLEQISSTAVTEIEYQRPLLFAVGAAIVLAIVASIVLEIISPIKAAKRDVRDADISRLGEYVGGIVFAVGMVLPFALAMTEADHFWIANSMYLAGVLSALAGTAVKLVAYRRGL